MVKMVAIANQKGGVGKTTTAINLCASLVRRGRRVLLVDCDPQGNATTGMGIDRHEVPGIYDVLLRELPAEKAVIHTQYGDVIAASPDLAAANVELVDQDKREYRLRQKLSPLFAEYDYILADCPPSLELLTLNVLTAANSVIVPVQAEFYALEGLSDLTSTIRRINQRLNPSLKLEGLVLTMYDNRTKISTDVETELKRHFPGQVYETTIPRNVRLSEAPSHGVPCIGYDRMSKGARAYLHLANEFLKSQGKGE